MVYSRKKGFCFALFVLLFICLTGCGKKQETTELEDVLAQGVESFVFEDTYEIDAELLKKWTSDEMTGFLAKQEEKSPASVAFIRGNLAMGEGDADKAEKYFDLCIENVEKKRQTDMYAKCLYEKAKQHLLREEYDKADACIDEIQMLYEGKKDRNAQIRINVLWAYDVMNDPNGIDKSVALMEKTRTIAYEYDFNEKEYVLFQLALSCSYLETMLKANSYYEEAYRVAKENKNLYWMSTISCEIGNIYLSEENYDKAMEYFDESYQVLTEYKENEKALLSQKLNLVGQMAQCLIEAGKLEEAKVRIDELKSLIDQLGEGKAKSDEWMVYHCVNGKYLHARGEYDAALEELDLSLELSEKDDYSFYYGYNAYIYDSYAEAYMDMGDYEKAKEACLMAESLYSADGRVQEELDCRGKLFDIYYQEGDYENAAKYAQIEIEQLNKKIKRQNEVNENYVLEALRVSEKEAKLKELQYNNRFLTFFIVSCLIFVVLIIGYAINVLHKNKKIYALNTRLTELTYLDELTKLNNRRSMNEFFEGKWKTLCQENLPLSAVMIDIDYFKKYNDFYGHTKGDIVISEVARIIRENITEKDFAVRYGGEEFLIILPGIAENRAVDLLIDMQEKIKELAIEHQKSAVSEYVTISVGIATIYHQVEYLTLIDAADDQLYKAKKLRNKIEYSGF